MAKSKTFQTEVIETDTIVEDLATLRSIRSEQLSGLSEFWSNGTINQRSEVNQLEEELQRLDISPIEYSKLKRIIMFIIQSCVLRHDDIENVIDDIVLLEVEGVDSVTIRQYLESNIPVIESEIKKSIIAATVAHGIPQADSIGYVCDARLIPKTRFRSLVQKAQDYHPEALGWEPVAIIKIGADDESFLFQVNENLLSRLIEGLIAAKKDLEYTANTIRIICSRVGDEARDD